MTSIQFKPATRKKSKARVALVGPSKSGKTLTGLRIAKALADAHQGRVAVIDTEHGSASKYEQEGLLEFDVVELTSYQPDNYVAALDVAAENGYPVVLIDSLSHAWTGEGGVLEIVDQARSRFGGNQMGGWIEGTPAYQRLVRAILTYPGHVICTMRAKTEWVQAEDERGRKVPQKLGLKPEMRGGIEYEFDVFCLIDETHTLRVDGTRCQALDGQSFPRPSGADFAAPLLEWLDSGEAAADLLQRVRAEDEAKQELQTLRRRLVQLTSTTPQTVRAHLTERFGEFDANDLDALNRMRIQLEMEEGGFQEEPSVHPLVAGLPEANQTYDVPEEAE